MFFIKLIKFKKVSLILILGIKAWLERDDVAPHESIFNMVRTWRTCLHRLSAVATGQASSPVNDSTQPIAASQRRQGVRPGPDRRGPAWPGLVCEKIIKCYI